VCDAEVILSTISASVLELLVGFDVDSCAFAYTLDEGKVYTTPRGLRALRTSCNVIDTTRSSPTYFPRLEKYVQRGFAIACPGLVRENISKQLLRSSYVYFLGSDILLKTGSEHRTAHSKTLPNPTKTSMSDPSTIRVHAAAVQKGRIVIGLPRILVLDMGLARVVGPPGCFPLSLGQGDYEILWGVQEKELRALPRTDALDPDAEPDYSPVLAHVFDALSQITDEDLLRAETEDGWCSGGVMKRITASLKRSSNQAYKAAKLSMDAKLSRGERMLFLWDLISTEAPWSALRFVLDAQRAPHYASCDFEKVYGVKRRLEFKRLQKKEAPSFNIWEGVY